MRIRSALRHPWFVLLMSGLLSACGSGSSDPGATNQAPVVDAGDNQVLNLPTQQTELIGTVSDDGLPGSGLSAQWRQLDGPAGAEAVFGDAAAVRTTVNLPQTGIYTLELTASDGALSATDTVQITLQDPAAPSGLTQRPDNLSCVAPALAPAPSGDITLRKAFPDLSNLGAVVALIQPPRDNSTWYAVLQSGQVMEFANSPAVTSARTFIDIQARVRSGGELGLLGMAFHPQYDGNTNQKVYLYYTTNEAVDLGNGDTVTRLRSRISEFTPAGNDWNEEILLTLNQPDTNHNGGNIAFGADGYLYIGLGDGGGANDLYNGVTGHGQDTTTLLGSMLRIDVDSASPYAIPGENPFFGNALCNNPEVVNNAADCPEIYAWGLRNPWRWSFDRQDQSLWLGDVGQNATEEVSRIEVGKNYGWKIMEGSRCNTHSSVSAQDCANALNDSVAPFVEAPVAEYDHGNNNRSIVGGYVYRGADPQLSFLVGTYLYADTYSGRIWGLTQNGNDYVSTELLQTTQFVYSFAQGNNGELYILKPTFGGGTGDNVFRIAADTGGDSGQVAGLLSQSGCVDSADPTQPAPGLIPYDLISPLWSDNAAKERFIALPNDTQIDLSNEGDFLFPVGTVLVKHFKLNGRPVETRLLMRHENGWGGYSYEWTYDDQGNPLDALLLADAKTKFIEGQNWYYPSRSECFSCHTQGANVALGPETLQLNRRFTYPSTGIDAEQLTTLEHIGVFSSALTAAHKAGRLHALDDAGASLQDRAKSYLHSNCAQCHHPNGVPQLNMDLRFLTALQDMNICDVAPARGNLGLADPKLIDPTAAANSVLPLRMARPADSGVRMPPLATEVVDSAALTVIDNWVNALAACP